MSVDGQALTVRGYLVLAHPIQSWLWFVVAAVIARVAIVAGKRKRTFVAGVALTLAGAVALYVGAGEHKVVPKRAGGTLAGWTIMRIAVLTKPILPTSLSYNVDRAGTVLAVGVAIGAAVLAVSSGGLVPRLPDLSDDE